MAKRHTQTGNLISITLTERIFLSSIFPPKGNIITLRIRRDIMNKIDFKQDEIAKYKLAAAGESVTYDLKFEKTKFSFSLTDLEFNEIKLALKQMDQKGEMHISMLDLCDKFKVTE